MSRKRRQPSILKALSVAEIEWLVSADPLEIYDHVFSPTEAQAVKGCLLSLARHTGRRAGRLAAAGWRAILIEAHRYAARQAQGPIKKERISRAINRFSRQPVALAVVRGDDLLTRRSGRDSINVRLVRRGESTRGRPSGGEAGRDTYIAVVCSLYEQISGRRPTMTWDDRAGGARGPLFELLRAALAPEIFRQKARRPLSDAALVSAVRRIRGRLMWRRRP